MKTTIYMLDICRLNSNSWNGRDGYSDQYPWRTLYCWIFPNYIDIETPGRGYLVKDIRL